MSKGKQAAGLAAILIWTAVAAVVGIVIGIIGAELAGAIWDAVEGAQ